MRAMRLDVPADLQIRQPHETISEISACSQAFADLGADVGLVVKPLSSREIWRLVPPSAPITPMRRPSVFERLEAGGHIGFIRALSKNAITPLNCNMQ